MFRRYLREKHPPKGYTTDMPEDIFGCWLATWMRCVNDVSTYSSSHSSRHFLGGCCSRWICIWHFCSLSWVGCILSHVVHRYEILWGMWGSGLGDGLSVWVLQESESLHFILSTSHRAFFFSYPKTPLPFGEAQNRGSREKGPWLGSKLWPKPLGRHPIRTFFLRWPAIRAPSAYLLGSLVHVTTSYSIYPIRYILRPPTTRNLSGHRPRG